MPSSMWNPADRQVLFERMDRLGEAARPAWGSMTPTSMVAHLCDGVKMATGELATTPLPGPLGWWPLNVLVMFYLPWPKSAPTAPELLRRTSASVGAGVQELKSEVESAVARGPQAQWAVHPAFGPLTHDQWGRLLHRHVDHHLTQFGV